MRAILMAAMGLAAFVGVVVGLNAWSTKEVVGEIQGQISLLILVVAFGAGYVGACVRERK